MKEITLEYLMGRISIGSGDCWNYTGTIGANGYGNISIYIDGKVRTRTVTRVVWELKFGPIPPGYLVCHKCDNPRCINPDHLFLGTRYDNNHDMMDKGRFRSGNLPGEANPGHKLTWANVTEIRTMISDGAPVRLIAKRFTISPSVIYLIKAGKKWKECNRPDSSHPGQVGD